MLRSRSVQPVERPATLDFATVEIATLDRMSAAESDQLDFGVVGLSPQGIVHVYNDTESRLAGIARESVMGTHYFSGTAQCMNNFMVAQHFVDERQLDLTIEYVLTLRMRPTPVRLRLLKAPGATLAFVLIQRL